MKVLVAVAAYPTSDGKRALYYVHSRNLYYKEADIEVEVLNFSANEDYVIDDISVITLASYRKYAKDYDLLVCHAANLRNHYRFLRKYGDCFKKKIFIFHGHEILHINKYYPKPYGYKKTSIIRQYIQNAYDDLKLVIWRNYYLKNIEQLRLIFVSDWLFKQFLKELRIQETELKEKHSIISNSIGKFFEENEYKVCDIKYDFLTIRNYMDDSKYCVDIVCDMAKKNPMYNFCVIGKGNFFEHNEKPNNITWINDEISHDMMRQYIDSSRYALLPTREDTQGLMACELVAYGIPLITSDIEICKEVFDNCKRVAFIDNAKPDLQKVIANLDSDDISEKWNKYYAQNTIYKEIDYIKEYVGE